MIPSKSPSDSSRNVDRNCVRSHLRVSMVGVDKAATPEGSFIVEPGSSAIECRTRNRESPGSGLKSPLLPFRSLGIFVLSTKPQFIQLYK